MVFGTSKTSGTASGYKEPGVLIVSEVRSALDLAPRTSETERQGTEDKMRKHISKIMAILLLIGVAQTLSACIIEDGGHYHHWHDDGWHHHY